MPRVVADEWLYATRHFFNLYQFLRQQYPQSFPRLADAADEVEENIDERN